MSTVILKDGSNPVNPPAGQTFIYSRAGELHTYAGGKDPVSMGGTYASEFSGYFNFGEYNVVFPTENEEIVPTPTQENGTPIQFLSLGGGYFKESSGLGYPVVRNTIISSAATFVYTEGFFQEYAYWNVPLSIRVYYGSSDQSPVDIGEVLRLEPYIPSILPRELGGTLRRTQQLKGRVRTNSNVRIELPEGGYFLLAIQPVLDDLEEEESYEAHGVLAVVLNMHGTPIEMTPPPPPPEPPTEPEEPGPAT